MLRGGGWAVGGTFLLSLLGLGINALLSRLLPTGDLGVYFLVISLTALSAAVAQAGVLQVLLRRVALSPMINGKVGAAQTLWSVCLYVGVGLTLVCILILASFGHWAEVFVPDKPQVGAMVFLIVAWVAVLTFQGVVTEAFRGLHDIRNTFIFGGVLTNSVFIAMLGAWYAGGYRPMLGDVIAWIVAISFLTMLLGLLLLSRRVVAVEKGGHIARMKSLYRESVPLLLSNLLMIVLAQGDLWLVGFYLGSEATALYGAAVKLAVLIGMPLNLLNAVLPPYIAQMHAAGKHGELENILRGSAGLAGIPAAILALIAVFYGGDLLALLYGEHFRQAAPVLAILCIGYFTHVALGSGGLVMMLTGHGKALLATTLLSSAVLLLGGVMAAPHGVVGIALAAACALILQKAIMWLWINSKLGISTHARINRNTFNVFQSAYGKSNHVN